MSFDPRTNALLTSWADELGIPREFALGIHLWESGGGNLDAVGDDGRSFGGLQMHAPVWGWPGEQWTGFAGLMRSVGALTPQWRRASRPLLFEYARMAWPARVEAFARFWASAQIADAALVAEHAEAALRLGVAALNEGQTPMPNLDVFRQRAVWAYTWTPGAQLERDGAAIAATLGRFGITAFWQEAYYGLTWQGAIDRRKNGGVYGSPASLDEFIALRDQLASAGITLLPVVVPLGLHGEAERHAEVARACGAIVVDLESDSSGDYWPWARAHEVRIYAGALREAAGPDVAICWEPDGRLADPGRRAEWDQLVEPVREYVNVWSPQLYAGWPLYGVGQRAIEADAARWAEFAQLGPMCPTLYLAESLNEPAALWQTFRERSLGLCGFRFGAMGADALTLLGSFSLTTPVTPAPPPDRTRELLDALTVSRDDFWRMRDQAAVRGDHLDSLIKQWSA